MTVLIIIWSVWFVSEIIINRLFRAKKKSKVDFDKGSMRNIWRVIGVANLIAVSSAVFLTLPISKSVAIPVLGALLIVAGMLIRILSIMNLGKMFTVNVNINDNHRIIKQGMYKFIRHPSYLGSILSFAGFGLSLNNWISLIVILILIPGVMAYRITIEEKVLLDAFGDEYSAYTKKTYRLIPLIW
jgi:protein-S-isoprenylcysteine O-methyltransferase Ste14